MRLLRRFNLLQLALRNLRSRITDQHQLRVRSSKVITSEHNLRTLAEINVADRKWRSGRFESQRADNILLRIFYG